MVKININLEKECSEIDSYEPPINYRHRCPLCGSIETVRNGTYTRNVVYIRSGKVTVKRIRLQRFLCKACMKTRTSYPGFLVRGREYSVASLFYVCTSPSGRNVLSENTGIPVNQIRSLRTSFRQIVKRVITVAGSSEIHLEKLIKKYSDCFGVRPFAVHQRDVSITLRS